MEVVVAAVEALAAVSFAGGAISSTTVGGEGSRCSEDGDDFPSLAVPLSDWDGECRWGVAAEVNLVS
jgi:hypothetical protein